MNKQGLLVTLEAPEGGGKTLLGNKLKEHYEEKGIEVILSREPGGIEVAEMIRNIVVNYDMAPSTEAYLYLAARAEHVDKVVRPALEAGKLVILDRFMYSTLAIQGGGRGLDIKMLRNLHILALKGVIPGFQSLNLFLDINPEIGLKRKFNQGEINKFEKEDIKFHKDVYNTYLNFCRTKELTRINAEQSPDDVAIEAIYHINKYLNI